MATTEREEFEAKVRNLVQASRDAGWSWNEGHARRIREEARQDAARTAVLDAYAAAEARVKELETALTGVLPMAQKWADYAEGGDKNRKIVAARAALPAPTKED
jgi:hypothetical protein